VSQITLLGIPGGPELFIVLGVILLLFGSAKLPKLARSLGASVTEFKKGIKSGGDEDAKRISGSDPDADPDAPGAKRE
jgi:sec-independent protein translocase protein TatA